MTAPATGVADPGEDVDGFLLGCPRAARCRCLATAAGAGQRSSPSSVTHLQERVRTVHVAGTAGKGSACAFVAALLAEHGCVGTQTSPHVYSVRERFLVGGQPVGRPSSPSTWPACGPPSARSSAVAGQCAFFEV
ncbi:hypothetical protein HBB16_02185 [Pseudonocardia sp. MCCB 268]|nr:hypothetical protein [Pseudonocardia cytotoxica]